MKLLKKMLKEEGAGGAVGGGAVAAAPMPLGMDASVLKPKKKKKTVMIKRIVPGVNEQETSNNQTDKSKFHILTTTAKQIEDDTTRPQRLQENFGQFATAVFDLLKNRIPSIVKTNENVETLLKRELLHFQREWRTKLEEDSVINSFELIMEFEDQPFDTETIISKLKSMERKSEKFDKQATTEFGLKDEDGNTILVTVPQDQADSFESALRARLSGSMGSRLDQREPPSVEEVLFQLKDHFSILDVSWPTVPEDQEVSTNIGMGEEPEGEDTAMGGEDDLGLDLEGGEEMAPPAPRFDATTALQQVIDMMMADAEARKAEAERRKQEAKAKEIEALASQSRQLVKQEEEILDMERQQKAEKEREKEIKRLAQLAKWKKEAGAADEGNLGASEEAFGVGKGMQTPPGLKAEMGLEDELGIEQEETSMRRPDRTKAQHGNPAHMKRQAMRRLTPKGVADYILRRVK